MPTRAKLAAIHIAKKQAGLSDEAYRRILRDNFNVKSAKELDDSAASQLVRDLSSRRQASAPGEPAVAKIWALWYNEIKPYLPEREQTSFYLLGIVRKASGSAISRPDDFRRLNAKQMYKAIEALKLKADELSPIPF